MSTSGRSYPIILNFNLMSQTKCLRKEINIILVENLKKMLISYFIL